MVVKVGDNPLRSERGLPAALDALHHVFVLLHLHSLEAVKKKEPYAPEFICELSDWLEVLPTYLVRDDEGAMDDFRNGLAAIVELHPCFRSVLNRFNDGMRIDFDGSLDHAKPLDGNGTQAC